MLSKKALFEVIIEGGKWKMWGKAKENQSRNKTSLVVV